MFEEIEQEIASYTGKRHAVVCSSGRTALLLSLSALGIGHGDDVIVPDFVDQIVPLTVFCAGATTGLCDINRGTLALSPESFSKMIKPTTKAVIFVHLYGYPVDPSPIMEIASRNKVAFIDDAAQALGASINGKKAGSFGDVGITTFNKSLKAFLGGALTTDNERLASRARMIRERYESRSFFADLSYRMMKYLRFQSQKTVKLAFLGDNYLHKLRRVSFARKHFEKVDRWVEPNGRTLALWQSNSIAAPIANQLMMSGGLYLHKRKLDEMEVSLLRNELKKSDRYIRDRKTLAETYDKVLIETCFSKIRVPSGCAPSYLRYPVLFDSRDGLVTAIRELVKAGINLDGRYGSLHTAPFFMRENAGVTFEESSYVSGHILPLPLKQITNVAKVERIASLINSVFSEHNK